MLDHGEHPPFLVLEYMDTDALRLSGDGKLSRSDIKLIARSTLRALSSLHAKGRAHTDIKPDNILLNLDRRSTAVVDVKLADCGDAWHVGPDIDLRGEGYVIGAAIFRSPEPLLGLRLSTSTDIWSFGATLISLLWGRGLHLFKPPNISADDEEFPVHVLVQQPRYFGPFPLSYEEVLDREQNQILAAVHIHIYEQDLRKPFFLVEDKEVTQEDKDFIYKKMRLDPRDRPTADELLADRWFGLP